MNASEAHFMVIAGKFSSTNPDVSPGRMMSSPALKYRDKVFAFYFKNAMCFRLCPKFNPIKFGLKNAKPLSPFKTKPPLKGWVVVEGPESNLWETLTSMALEYTMTL